MSLYADNCYSVYSRIERIHLDWNEMMIFVIVYSGVFVIFLPPKFSYRTDLLLMNFLYRIEASRWRERFGKTFIESHLPICLVNIVTIFLYINSIIADDRGSKNWWELNKRLLFSHLHFVTRTCFHLDCMRFHSDTKRVLHWHASWNKRGNFSLRSSHTLRLLQITLCHFDAL